MQELQIGRVYRHFKGDYYLVEGLAHDSESGVPCVIYRKLQHWITIYPGLPGRLLSLGYHEGERVYSPAMVRAIIESLGEP